MNLSLEIVNQVKLLGKDNLSFILECLRRHSRTRVIVTHDVTHTSNQILNAMLLTGVQILSLYYNVKCDKQYFYQSEQPFH